MQVSGGRVERCRTATSGVGSQVARGSLALKVWAQLEPRRARKAGAVGGGERAMW